MQKIDPSGLEHIVISGGVTGKEQFRYMFIETGIKAIKDLQRNTKEQITWIISNSGYSHDDIKNFKTTANELGVNIIIANNKDNIINYINTKGSSKKTRSNDKITDFAVLSHGLKGSLALGHKRNTNLNILAEDIDLLDSSAFNNTSTWFGSCNTGTGGTNSFAQLWVNKTGGYATGVVDGQTNYTEINDWAGKSLSDRINSKLSRVKRGFDINGSRNYPRASDTAYWNTFSPQ